MSENNIYERLNYFTKILTKTKASLFSTLLNEYKTKTNCKTESNVLLCSTYKTVTVSMSILGSTAGCCT